METVHGIGGFFFRAKDPKALNAWYRDHLGIALVPRNYNEQPWRQGAGPTAFEAFPQSTDYFGDKSRMWMLNFRVRSLDAMVKQLSDAGIKVTVDDHTYPNGRFAQTADPEGNPIQLWEPSGPDAIK